MFKFVFLTPHLGVYFLMLKEGICETTKNVFIYFTEKLFSFFRKSNFEILDV